MKCYLCGNEISPQDKFCSYCGEQNIHHRENVVQNPYEPNLSSGYPELVRTTRKSAASAKVVAIYSIVLGGLSFLGNISQGNSMLLNYVIIGIMIGFGIAILKFIQQGDYKEKGYIVTLLVIYCLEVLVGFLFLAIPQELVPIQGFANLKITLFLLVEAIVITPFIFCIRYLRQAARGL